LPAERTYETASTINASGAPSADTRTPSGPPPTWAADDLLESSAGVVSRSRPTIDETYARPPEGHREDADREGNHEQPPMRSTQGERRSGRSPPSPPGRDLLRSGWAAAATDRSCDSGRQREDQERQEPSATRTPIRRRASSTSTAVGGSAP
jgi:hypothetical protein